MVLIKNYKKKIVFKVLAELSGRRICVPGPPRVICGSQGSDDFIEERGI